MARSIIRSTLAFLALVATYAVLFTVGSQALMPAAITDAATSADEQVAGAGLIAVAFIDVAIIVAITLTSRLRGVRLWVLLSVVLYGVKSFTSQLEAWYFMKNLTPEMLPALFGMMVPALVVVPLLSVVLFGRMRGAPEAPAWRVPAMPAGEWALKLVVLACVVYPVLFFGFGYFVAWQSPAVREFYGVTELLGPVDHLRNMVRSDPLVVPFEMLRGALWVAFAVTLIWTTQGSGILGGVLAVLVFALVQNDVHLIPNPLMPAAVRQIHFVETATSNAINALIITWLMRRAHWGRGVTTACAVTA
jgi:hypothetical protein